MKSVMMYLFPILAIGLLLLLRGNSMFASASATAPLNPDSFRAVMQEGGLLVDVRTPGEFAEGHMSGAVNIPLDRIDAAQAQLGATDRPIVVYCRSGNRSGQATRVLAGMGYGRVYDIQVARNW
jgi:phage shock protein E